MNHASAGLHCRTHAGPGLFLFKPLVTCSVLSLPASAFLFSSSALSWSCPFVDFLGGSRWDDIELAPSLLLFQYGFISVQTQVWSAGLLTILCWIHFSLFPQARPAEGNQAKDPLDGFQRHILETLRTEKASRPSRSGAGAGMAAQGGCMLHKFMLLHEMIF